MMYECSETQEGNLDLHIYVPLMATSAQISLYGPSRSLIGSTKLDLLGAEPAWCSLEEAGSANGCSYQKISSGYLVTGQGMFQRARELNQKGVPVRITEKTRFGALYTTYAIKNDAVETELFFANSDSVFPESLHGIHWMDQRGTALPLKSDPEYQQVCESAAEEVLMTFGEAGWDPETLCATGVSQYSGSPLSGHWTWLNYGPATSPEWASGAGWNAEYRFCFRDSSFQFVDVLLQVPLNKLPYMGWWPLGTRIELPTWINNVGMSKTAWGWDRVTTIGPAWLRSILRVFGIDRLMPAMGGGCHYPLLPIVDGRGERTEHYDAYLAYVNTDTECEEPSFTCPRNRGQGTQLVGRLAGIPG